MKRKLFILSICGGIVLLLILVSIFQVSALPQYKTTKAQKRDIKTVVEFTTNLYPSRYIRIDLGKKESIKGTFVKNGDTVTENTVLVQLDDSVEQDQYKSAKTSFNQLAGTRNSLRTLKTSLNSIVPQLQQESTTNYTHLVTTINGLGLPQADKDVLLASALSIHTTTTGLTSLTGTAISSVDLTSSTQAGINAASAQMQSAQKSIDARKIRAPFAGTVLFIKTDSITVPSSASSSTSASSLSALASLSGGSTSSLSGLSSLASGSALGGTGLASVTSPTTVSFDPRQDNYLILADQSEYKVFAQVSETDVIRIKKDMPVTLTTKLTIVPITAKVLAVYPIPVTQGMEEPKYYVEMLVTNSVQDFPVGVSITGKISIAEKPDALALPYDALSFDQSNKGTLFTLVDGKKQTASVQIGIIGNDWIEVTAGIDDGTTIIVDELPAKQIITLRPWIKRLIGKN